MSIQDQEKSCVRLSNTVYSQPSQDSNDVNPKKECYTEEVPPIQTLEHARYTVEGPFCGRRQLVHATNPAITIKHPKNMLALGQNHHRDYTIPGLSNHPIGVRLG